ncbi:MAG: uracil phosphoribosyltransferase [Spirochaetaceae bacterium]|jgi:uracil phosphoribosyltransferase|nr:uracil phosphoribosyltransferase [Spirochaetaceae bacterium]
MNKVILKAEDLDGFLTEADKTAITGMDSVYRAVLASFRQYSVSLLEKEREKEKENLIRLYNKMGKMMQTICSEESGIQVYSFRTPHETHAEISRIIAKLRDVRTDNDEFIYYIQRAYEKLFYFAWGGMNIAEKNYLMIKTPVTIPVQNYAVHKITNIDSKIENTVMCVLLRGALLPAMIMSKEIEEYSSNAYVTPFALFRIKRDETKRENDMEYILDLDRSYFNLDALDGKDLIFADPMNATGGSLVTVVKYLVSQGITPRSVHFFNVISALKGALRVVRALDNCTVWTCWMDPVLNEAAYILPGLGDAGDRINGRDSSDKGRNIMQLIADYGSNIAGLYRSQLREIEDTVLGRL